MLTSVDVVHGIYYLIMWPVARIAGTGELAMRLPSALAMSATAVLIVAIGRRVVSQSAGLAAGVVWAVLPVTSWYGQDARSYAMATTLACAASYLLLRVLAGEVKARWYAVSLVALGAMNLFALLLLPAHGVTVLVLARDRAREMRRWLMAAGCAVLVIAPLMVIAWRQRADIEWIPPLNRHEAGTMAAWGGTLAVSQLTELIIVAGVACAAGGWLLLRSRFPGAFLALCLPWALIPLAVLVMASEFMPAFEFRYVLISVPALALLAGAAVSAVGMAAGVAALAVLALVSVPGQLGDRGPLGHYENLRQLDQIIAGRQRPGDAVLYTWSGWRQAAAAYPYGLATLDDIGLGQTPLQAGNLLGTDLPEAAVVSKLAGTSRVWLVLLHYEPSDPLLAKHNFRLDQTWQVADVWLQLYRRGR
jgi:mannosyltransferase